MIDKTALRQTLLYAIKTFPKGRKFTYSELYKWAEDKFPDFCSKRGDAKKEPRYKHDVRAAVWDAMRLGIVRHTGIRGERIRV
jgi:hypothetical protein